MSRPTEEKTVRELTDEAVQAIKDALQNQTVENDRQFQQLMDVLEKGFEKMIRSHATVIADRLTEKLEAITSGGILTRDFYERHPMPLDLVHALNKIANEEAVVLARNHLHTAMLFGGENLSAYWKYALSKVSLDGLFLEFGVGGGRSINFFACHKPDRTFHGFDSFEGLPEDWTGWTITEKGFCTQGIPRVKSNVILYEGLFEETLPLYGGNLTDEVIAFMHIDCDLYSSTKTVFDQLGDRLRPGTIILFDEYFNYPSWKQHEYKAFQELCDERSITFTYVAFCLDKACVRLDSIGRHSGRASV